MYIHAHPDNTQVFFHFNYSKEAIHMIFPLFLNIYNSMLQSSK